jgi:hypothetical protein
VLVPDTLENKPYVLGRNSIGHNREHKRTVVIATDN